MLISEIVVWVSVSLIAYTYLVYVLILYAAVQFKKSSLGPQERAEVPSVSVVFSAYNEAATLPHKIDNLHKVHYPLQKIEFMIGSDGSTDTTSSVLNSLTDPRFRIYDFALRRGKAAVLNDLVLAAKGEVVVFTDANTVFMEDTVERLVKCFNDPKIGAVCGNLVLRADIDTTGGAGESVYWRYENTIKRLESEYKTVFGGTGAVYAIRRALYRSLPTMTPVTDDLVIPLRILCAGFYTKYEAEAIAFEDSENSVLREFRRKTRISAQNFHSLREFVQLLNPNRGFVAFGLWSHKIIRWFVPFLLISTFFSTLMLSLENQFYRALLMGQIFFVMFAILGLVLDLMKKRVGLFGIPYYVLATNTALLAGFLRFLFKLERPMWEVNRS